MARKLGVPGVALFTGTIGLYLVYVGVKKVPFTEGLRALTQGRNPSSLAQTQESQSIRQGTPSSVGLGVGPVIGSAIGAPVPMSETVIAGGIRVHKSIAKNVTKMVSDANRAGIRLTGGGWRSSATQAALRLKNGCTCSNSSSCCRVPTAPVGQSMHERGLAIDFDGVEDHSHPVFKWMERHGASYGFYNLPSEAWHWSTNGH